MGNVFGKAVEAAQARAKWAAKMAPKDGEGSPQAFTEAQMAEGQKHIEAFQAAMVKAAKESKFATAEEVSAELKALDYEKQYQPLRIFAELSMPIQKETMLIASVLSPSRLAIVERAREGKFGVFDLPLMASKNIVHRAREESSEPTRGPAAREVQEAKVAEQSKAFDQLSGAIGSAMKGAPKGRSVDQAKKALDALGGVKMVEGEKVQVGSKARGQMALFGEELAPTPPRKPGAAKSGKRGK